jgi:glycosyltransferase involved in cell wall biosynthesis
MSTTPTFSVVVPVHNEAGNVLPLLREICDVMSILGEPFEVIFVNDGSVDATLEELRTAVPTVPALRVIDLDGNFGEAAALCAGFRAARGSVIVTLDGDGQNDPHDIPQAVRLLRQQGCRVVSGWRRDRKEAALLRVWPSRLANRLIALVTGVPVRDNGCGLKVYERGVVEQVMLPRGMNRFMPAIFGVQPHEVINVAVNDRQRAAGQSHYGIGRTLIVLRDLLALRLIIAGSRRAEPLAAAMVVVAAGATASTFSSAPTIVTLACGLAAGVAGLIWWNLRRFNHAQRHGAFRVRGEYSHDRLGKAA